MDGILHIIMTIGLIEIGDMVIYGEDGDILIIPIIHIGIGDTIVITHVITITTTIIQLLDLIRTTDHLWEGHPQLVELELEHLEIDV